MKLTERLRKADWLNELRAFVIAGVVLAGGFTVLEVIGVTLGGAAIDVQLERHPAGPQEFVLGGQTMRQLGTEVSIADPTAAQVGWYLTAKLPSVVVLAAALAMLLRLLTRARRANPFTRATVRDLRWTAVILMGGGLLASLVEAVASMGISRTIQSDTIIAVWNMPLLWLLVGAGTLAVAEIVARGCAMREELDEVV